MRRFVELICVLAVALPLSGSPLHAQGVVRVLMRTELGEIELEIDSARAPVTATNFLRYVDAKQYDGGVFHRTVRMDNQPNNDVKIEVIQARGRRDEARVRHPAIALERTSVTGLKHLDGTLSMARAGPDTAVDEIFICIGDQPSLDFGGARNADGQGFAAFGKVTRGMEVVRAIQGREAQGQTLVQPVRIVEVRRM